MKPRKRLLKKLIKILIFAALTALLIFCCMGCRARITDDENVTDVVPDESGMKAEQFEKKREELGIEKTLEPIIDNNADTNKTTPSEQGKARGNGGSRSGGSGGSGKAGKDGGKNNGNNTNTDDKKGNRNKEKKKTVVVSFDARGGNCDISKKKVAVGSAYGELPVPEREGFNFTGWYAGSDEGNQVTAGTVVTLKEDHTLFAGWREATKKDHTLTFDPNEGRMKSRDKKRTVTEGELYGELPLPVRTGHEFVGWFTYPDGGEQVSAGDRFELTTDQTLYAHWSYDPYKYWSQTLQTIYESMYACQVIDCYIEFADNETASSCSFLDRCKAGNAARNRGSETTVTDQWIESRNPSVIIKCTDQSAGSAKAAMEERFPGRRILVVPTKAVYGSNSEQVYFSLYLGKVLYPSWYEEVDIAKAGEELGVSGEIYE
jgi:uncharacterized repeat protein (TIGR02543 family)